MQQVILLFFFTVFCSPGWAESTPLPLSFEYEVGYWQAREGGLAFTTQPSDVFTTIDYTESSLVSPTFHWNVGFDLGLAYEFMPSWAVSLDWMYLHAKGTGSQNTTEFEGIFPVRSIFDGVTMLDYARQAEAFWKLEFNRLNVDFVKSWQPYSFFSTSLVTGLSNVWIAQRGYVNYSGGSFAAGVDENLMSSHCFAIGPKLGVIPKFFLGKGFSLYGLFSMACFGAFFHDKQQETFALQEKASSHHDQTVFRWNFDASSGFEWKKFFPKKQFTLSLELGWDYFYFNRQNVFKHAQIHLSSQGNLIISGGHFKLGWIF